MTNLRALERMAQIVYGEVWLETYSTQEDVLSISEISTYKEDGIPMNTFKTIEQAVAHLIDVNQRQQVAFNEALRELGEGK